MADASSFFAIRVLNPDSTSWTPIIAPIPCNTWSIRPDGAVKIRTDQADASTEDTIAQGSQTILQSPSAGGIKFPLGTTFAFLQAVSGTVAVHVQFAR